MSGHVRFGFAALLVVAGYSTPAASNSFTDFFSPSPAPEAATAAPAPAPEDCLRQPGPATAGGHWVYRYDGHRKCWFQAEEGAAVAKKPVRHHVARRRVAAPEQDKPASRKQKHVVDARAELLRSAPAETSLPMRMAPELKVVDTAPVLATGVAAFVAPAPIEKLEIDRLAPDHPTRGQADVETRMAATPATRDAAPMSAVPVAYLTSEEVDDARSWTTTWLAVLLMALGLASILGSSRSVREALLLRR